jgi:UPF0755 protein
MKKLVVLVMLLAGCGYAGSQGYDWFSTQVHVPVSTASQPVAFHVDPGEGSDVVANDLKNHGLIRSTEVFLFYLRYQSNGATVQAGDFALNRNMSMTQIVDALGHARVLQRTVQLPEGLTMKQMAAAVEKAGVGTAADYTAAAQDMTWPNDFLQGRPAGAPPNLEGFLFPDSYQLDKTATPRDLVKRQLDRFAQVVTPDLRATAGQASAVRPAETLYSIVVLASIVEREVNQDTDRALTCGVFYNRLQRDIALQDDVTVVYGLGRTDPNLSAADLQKDTPYNTYIHKGLPPGPISNPGLASIKACLSPQKSDYLYFFADPKGVAHYAKTFAEFQAQQRQFGVGIG